MLTQQQEISIVMPCLNEAETLATCVDAALEAIKEAGVTGEVVVADNGSTDGSQRIAEDAGARVISVRNKGYGSALIGGIEKARGKYILMGDADGSYDFGELGRFLDSLREGNDLVMGCRLPAGGGIIERGAMPWKHRWIGNPVLSGLGKLFFRSPVHDFHCGLRAFCRNSILRLKLRCTGMEFASEMVVKSMIAKLRVAQIPITLRPDGRSRGPHLRSWRDGWCHLKLMLLFAPKWLFWHPGLLLFASGVIGFSALAFGPLTIAGITFETNTMLICAASIIIGFQAMFYAIFSKAFAIQSGLMKPDRRIQRLLDSNPVEWGIVIGLGLFGVGLTLFILAFSEWRGNGFGFLEYRDTLHVIIPSVVGMSLGVQILFSGFALALFNVNRD